jgi:hypothetical protein
MTRTITRSYDHFDDASAVVARLEAVGIASENISILSQNGEVDDSNAEEGAGIGGLAGGAAGLLAGLGMIAIPGIGPIVAAGWLASTAAGAVAGAAVGGLIGALTSAGVSERDAHYYAETMRRGGSIVSVRVADVRAAEVEAIMDGAGPIDPVARRAEYEREGWRRFDETASPSGGPMI